MPKDAWRGTVHRYRDLPARLNVVLYVIRVPRG